MFSLYFSEEYLYPEIQYLAFEKLSSTSFHGLC